MDRRGGSLPLPGDRGNPRSGPNSELQRHLQRRFRIVEGASGTLSACSAESNAASQHSLSQASLHVPRSFSPPPSSGRALLAATAPGATAASCQAGHVQAYPAQHSSTGPARFCLGSPPPSTGGSAVAAPCASFAMMPSSAGSFNHSPAQPVECPNGVQRTRLTPRVQSNTGPMRLNGSPVRRHEGVAGSTLNFNRQGAQTSRRSVSTRQGQYSSSYTPGLSENLKKEPKPPKVFDDLHNENVLLRCQLDACRKQDPKQSKEFDELRIDISMLQRQLEACRKEADEERAAKREALEEKASLEQQLRTMQETCDRQSETLMMQQEQLHRECLDREKLVREREQGKARLEETKEILEMTKQENAQADVKLKEQMQKHADTVQDNERLIVELAQLQGEKNLFEAEVARLEKSPNPNSVSSESALRSTMATPGTTTDELQQAILAVQSLVGEAQRELSSRRLREKRAAYERLHEAENQDDEQVLEEAIAEAVRTGINEEDMAKAEERLRKLRSMTDDEKAAKAAKELEGQQKARAFLMVKKDDGAQLMKILEGVDSASQCTKWQDWRDHSGRTLLQFARELQATSAHRILSQLLGAPSPADTKSLKFHAPPRGGTASLVTMRSAEAGAAEDEVNKFEVDDCSHSVQPELPKESASVSQSALKEPVPQPAKPSTPRSRANEGEMWYAASVKRDASPVSLAESPAASPDSRFSEVAAEAVELSLEEVELKAKALRAVVKDDTNSLSQVLERVAVDTWSNWSNKAGKDLITLSQERGSSAAYSLLARHLGLLKEQKRESFEDREAVWIMVQGEVQPRRATVLQDTAEEEEQVLVEFWDGYEPPSKIERCFVLKAC